MTRMMSSNEEGLSELERLVRRDRNHPSVFCWSSGNEEPEQTTDRGRQTADLVVASGRLLEQVLTDILDISRIEAGQLPKAGADDLAGTRQEVDDAGREAHGLA